MPFFVLLFLFLFGLFGIVAYVYFADRYCPAESIQHSLRLWDNRGYSENNKSSGRTRDAGIYRNDTDHAMAFVQFVAAKAEHSEGSLHAEAEPSRSHGWIVKFFCEAKAADAALVFFTYGLMIVTAWLAWATLKLWKAGEDQLAFVKQTTKRQAEETQLSLKLAEESVAVANLAAEATKEQVAVARMGVVDLERAYLAIGPTEIELRFIHRPGATHYVPTDPKEVVVRLYIHNTGRTAAVIRKLYGEFSQMPPTGETPAYRNGTETITDVSVAAGERDVLSPFEFADSFTGDQFFWGYVEYLDIFKNTRTSRFCTAIFPRDRKNGPDGTPIYSKYQMAGSDGWRECD